MESPRHLTAGDGVDLVFWPACVRLKPFREHVKAAVAGGFTSLAISADTVDEAIGAGLSLMDMRRIADDAGVPIRHFDTLTDWAPIRVPEWASPEMRARFDVPIQRAMEIIRVLGIRNILAVAGYPLGSVSLDRLIEGFGALCDQAAAEDIGVDLEFMPILGLPNLASAWEVVGGAARENSGILIDTWHFAKSNSDLDLLRSIPGRYLRSIQLSDGFIESRSGDLFIDMLTWREFPGHGELPVLGILKAVKGAGGLRQVGSEVFSDRANAMTCETVGKLSGETARDLFSQARLSISPSGSEDLR